MLSRVAERTYWLARYLERTENLARLCNVFGKLFLDLPRSASLGWMEILEIVDVRPAADGSDGEWTDARAIDLLIARRDNPSSLMCALALARENARTARDVLPTEAWLTINKLYLSARDAVVSVAPGGNLHHFLSGVVEGCQQMNGLLAGTMSHSTAYQFMRVGRHLERADMTTRTLDVAAAMLMSGRSGLEPLYPSLWASVLKSVSGYQMYRQYVRRRILAPDVVRFLFEDRQFPRSVSHCIDQVAVTLAMLPRNDGVMEPIAALRKRLQAVDTAELSTADLHQLIDRLQQDIARVHDAISDNWFRIGN